MQLAANASRVTLVQFRGPLLNMRHRWRLDIKTEQLAANIHSAHGMNFKNMSIIALAKSRLRQRTAKETAPAVSAAAGSVPIRELDLVNELVGNHIAKRLAEFRRRRPGET